jgi:hypothetical protein
MRKIRLFIMTFIIIVITISCGFNNSKIDKHKNAIADSLSIWLKSGTYTADIVNGFKDNGRMDELSKKMMASIQNNKDWYMDYVKTAPPVGQLPYNEKFGLTIDEYNELLQLYKTIEVKSTGTENFDIIDKGNKITFKANGMLKGLEFLTIDLVNLTINFEKNVLPFKNTIKVKTDSNALRTKWHGFEWEYQNPKDIDIQKVSSFNDISVEDYTFDIGRLEKSNKIYLSFKIVIIQNGEKTADNTLPIIF